MNKLPFGVNMEAMAKQSKQKSERTWKRVIDPTQDYELTKDFIIDSITLDQFCSKYKSDPANYFYYKKRYKDPRYKAETRAKVLNAVLSKSGTFQEMCRALSIRDTTTAANWINRLIESPDIFIDQKDTIYYRYVKLPMALQPSHLELRELPEELLEYSKDRTRVVGYYEPTEKKVERNNNALKRIALITQLVAKTLTVNSNSIALQGDITPIADLDIAAKEILNAREAQGGLEHHLSILLEE